MFHRASTLDSVWNENVRASFLTSTQARVRLLRTALKWDCTLGFAITANSDWNIQCFIKFFYNLILATIGTPNYYLLDESFTATKNAESMIVNKIQIFSLLLFSRNDWRRHLDAKLGSITSATVYMYNWNVFLWKKDIEKLTSDVLKVIDGQKTGEQRLCIGGSSPTPCRKSTHTLRWFENVCTVDF